MLALEYARKKCFHKKVGSFEYHFQKTCSLTKHAFKKHAHWKTHLQNACTFAKMITTYIHKIQLRTNMAAKKYNPLKQCSHMHARSQKNLLAKDARLWCSLVFQIMLFMIS